MSTHRRCWRLLPWYANGTLTGDEEREVRDHLEECVDCREELERCRALGELYESAASSAPAPHPARIERFWARARTDGESETPPHSRGTSPWRWIALAEAAVLAILVGSLAAGFPGGTTPAAEETAPAYRTLSSTAQVEAPGESSLFRVVFAPETPEREIREILLSLDARLVEGPSPYGVYTVAVPGHGEEGSVAERTTSRLREHESVRFAEPVPARHPGSPPE